MGPVSPQSSFPSCSTWFYRGDASRTAPGSGSGLGLAVVKKAVTAMGGQVRAENVDGGGLRIILTLPFSKEDSHG